MLVKELIEILQKMPQDAIVIQTYCSDYSDIEQDEITLVQGEAGKLIRHNGHLMDLDPRWWPAGKGEKPNQPEYLTAVHFPGL